VVQPGLTRKLGELTLPETYISYGVDFVYNLLTKVYNPKARYSDNLAILNQLSWRQRKQNTTHRLKISI
jgi:hypothetical protein